nr:hypothetical protein [Flavobacterium sp. N1718]
MINVYTDRDYLGELHRRFVFPLLFHLWYKEDEPLRQVYTLVTDDAAADVYVLPLSVEYYISNGLRAVMDRFIDQALQRQKPVWVYSSGDLGLTFTKPVWVFRFGGFDSKLGEQTIILPAHTTDPYRTLDKEFQPIDKETSPFIAFTGNADGSFGKWIKELYIQWYYFWHRFRRSIPSDPQPFFPSGIVRYRLLKKLQEDARIRTDFIFRKSYRAGAKTEDDRVRTHLEFFTQHGKSTVYVLFTGKWEFFRAILRSAGNGAYSGVGRHRLPFAASYLNRLGQTLCESVGPFDRRRFVGVPSNNHASGFSGDAGEEPRTLV